MNYKGRSKEMKRNIVNERYFGVGDKKSKEEYCIKKKGVQIPRKEGGHTFQDSHYIEIKKEEVSRSLGM